MIKNLLRIFYISIVYLFALKRSTKKINVCLKINFKNHSTECLIRRGFYQSEENFQIISNSHKTFCCICLFMDSKSHIFFCFQMFEFKLPLRICFLWIPRIFFLYGSVYVWTIKAYLYWLTNLATFNFATDMIGLENKNDKNSHL